jgi:hypothetical protein
VKSSRASWLSLSSHSVTGPKKTCWATNRKSYPCVMQGNGGLKEAVMAQNLRHRSGEDQS